MYWQNRRRMRYPAFHKQAPLAWVESGREVSSAPGSGARACTGPGRAPTPSSRCTATSSADALKSSGKRRSEREQAAHDSIPQSDCTQHVKIDGVKRGPTLGPIAGYIMALVAAKVRSKPQANDRRYLVPLETARGTARD